jgi:hypothetical protein
MRSTAADRMPNLIEHRQFFVSAVMWCNHWLS